MENKRSKTKKKENANNSTATGDKEIGYGKTRSKSELTKQVCNDCKIIIDIFTP